MNISTTTQVVYTFSLTKEEVHAVLEEPNILLKALKREVVFHANTPGRNGSELPRRGHRPKAKARSTNPLKRAGDTGSFICPSCRQPFKKAGYLRRHQEKFHGGSPAAGAADSSPASILA